MQVIPENKDKRRFSRGTDLVVIILYIEKISRCVERKYTGRFGIRRFRI